MYYVVYFGGCNYDIFLVNGNEVEVWWFVCFELYGYIFGFYVFVLEYLYFEFLLMLDFRCLVGL